MYSKTTKTTKRASAPKITNEMMAAMIGKPARLVRRFSTKSIQGLPAGTPCVITATERWEDDGRPSATVQFAGYDYQVVIPLRAINPWLEVCAETPAHATIRDLHARYTEAFKRYRKHLAANGAQREGEAYADMQRIEAEMATKRYIR